MSFKVTVTVTRAHLDVPPSAEASASARLLDANLAQMKALLDARGQPLPPGVDLKETGRLQASGQSSAAGYVFNVVYGEPLDARYHFAGVAPSYQAEAEADISENWDTQPLEIIED